jgi:hypothetical protein
MEVTRRFRQPFDSVPEFVRADVFRQAITNAIACALQQLCRRLDSDNGSQQLTPQDVQFLFRTRRAMISTKLIEYGCHDVLLFHRAEDKRQ